MISTRIQVLFLFYKKCVLELGSKQKYIKYPHSAYHVLDICIPSIFDENKKGKISGENSMTYHTNLNHLKWFTYS